MGSETTLKEIAVGSESQKSRYSTVQITQERLKELLDYDHITGIFIWKLSRGKAAAGQIAGSLYDNGYIIISVDGKRYTAHALAWLYVHGKLIVVDHKDDSRDNNAIHNLRPATESQNNHRKYTYNPLGYRGVRFRGGYYEANIRINGRITRIGQYNTPEEAGKAYEEAAKEHFGEFAYDPKT